MKKLILALCVAAAALPVAAKQQKLPSFSSSVYSNFRSYPVNMPAAAATRKTVQKNFPGWSAMTDKLNGTFTGIFGPPVEMPGNTLTEKANTCMSQYLHDLGVSAGDWTQVSNKSSGAKSYLYYNEVLNGHKVVMSRLSFQFAADGRLLKIEMKNYGSANTSLQPVVDQDAAMATATADLSGVVISAKQIAESWQWFPIPAASGYTLHPAWAFTITGRQNGMPVKLTGYVDAVTGSLLYRTNEVKDDFNVTVKGMVYKSGTLLPATLEPLPEISVILGGNTYNADTSGYYSNLALGLPLTATVPLAGPWSTVFDVNTGITPTFTDPVTVLGSTYTYPVTYPSSSRHINAYYHVNRVHNFMKKYFPAFTGMDFSLPTNVDDPSGSCNAFYDGTSINFYSAGGGCYSFADMGDVIYHEYGHGITDHMYTDITGQTIQNGALNEASSDIWALSITHNPILANNAFTPSGGFIRRFDMTPQVYPQDLFGFDPHFNGEIIAGTWWDVGVDIGSADTMTRLFTSVYWDVPDGFTGQEGMIYQTILVDALLADDNDNNIANGTPHYSQIVAAFARHGIYLEQDVTLTHQELDNAAPGVAIPVTANISIENPAAMQSLLVFYRRHTSAVWDSVVMTSNNGFDYTAQIPPQDTGTLIDYYFCMHDALNVPDGYFPMCYNPAIPAYQSSIPYQFGVGIKAMDSVTFETAATGWHIGGNAGDNATSGMWTQSPLSSLLYSSSIPFTDHTTGTSSGKCLVTANDTTGMDGYYVSNGATTVLSPVFNISTFHYPVIEYYRWFSNDLGENFKNDPWQVMIKDAGGSTWHQVEKTYQSDYNWRKKIFAVNEYLPAGTASIQIKFAASDSVLATGWVDNGQSTTAGAIDDFYMYDAKRAPTALPNTVLGKAGIYPNPADQALEISLPGNTATGTMMLYDMAGRKVYTSQITGSIDQYTISTRQLAAGQYTIVLQADGSVQSQKVVVRHNQ